MTYSDLDYFETHSYKELRLANIGIDYVEYEDDVRGFIFYVEKDEDFDEFFHPRLDSALEQFSDAMGKYS